jgi:hypothetical protein
VLEDAERLIATRNQRQAKRMPMLFSPTIGAAITVRYWYLWVRCPACRTINAINLRTLDRHHGAAVTTPIPALSCRSCRPNAPFAELVRPGHCCPRNTRWSNLAIIVWLEVRVLPGPPRSLAQTEISRLVANSPELAGIRARILSLQAVDWISGVVLGPLSLSCKIPFPGNRDLVRQRPVRL